MTINELENALLPFKVYIQRAQRLAHSALRDIAGTALESPVLQLTTLCALTLALVSWRALTRLVERWMMSVAHSNVIFQPCPALVASTTSLQPLITNNPQPQCSIPRPQHKLSSRTVIPTNLLFDITNIRAVTWLRMEDHASHYGFPRKHPCH
jgi:hypothetical protein